MAIADTQHELERPAADTRMPYGPYAGRDIADVPISHLVELLSEPFVPVLDEQGEAVPIAEEWLSPFGGALGKIRRCQAFAAVCERVQTADPEAWDRIESLSRVEDKPRPTKTRRARRKAT